MFISWFPDQIKLAGIGRWIFEVRHEKTDLKVFCRCHTKRRIGGALASQSLFWYDNDKVLKFCFLVMHLILCRWSIIVILVR